MWIRIISITALAAAACSPVTLAQDGGATTDSGPADAAVGLVTVIVLDDQQAEPVEGVNVAFVEADGTLVSMKQSDATGRAEETVHAGALIAVGRVTVTAENEYRVEIVTGVQPGDVIEMGPGEPNRTGNNLGMATAHLASAQAGATAYYAGDCNLNSLDPANPTADFTQQFIDDSCTRGATNIDLLGVAVDATGPIAYTTIDNAMPGGTFTSGAWNTAINQVDFTLSNAPYDATLDLSAQMYRDDIEYSFPGMLTTLDSVLAGDGGSFSLRYPAAFAEKVYQQVQIRTTDGSGLLSWSRNLSPVAGTQALNLTSDMLPQLDQVLFDDSTPEQPMWTYRINGAAPDATGILHAAFMRDSLGDEIYIVVVVGPPDLPSPFQLPVLPPDLITRPVTGENVWPPPPAATVLAGFTGLIEASFITGGWDQMRQSRPVGILFSDTPLPRSAPLGSTIRLSAGGVLPN
jgi:hypothetical protein